MVKKAGSRNLGPTFLTIFVKSLSASTLCDSLNCEFTCKSSLEGGVCTCQTGQKLANDSRTCVDKNECEEWKYCDQKCTNSVGSHTWDEIQIQCCLYTCANLGSFIVLQCRVLWSTQLPCCTVAM